MTILCLNGWGGKLHEALQSYLSDLRPDVLCLQEVVHSPRAEKAWLTYRDGDHILPQRANFFQDICAALPNHAATFCPAAQGVLWDGDVAIPSQWGLATFVHEATPVIAQVQGFVHKRFSPFSYGRHPRSRCAHAVRVFDYPQSRTVSITHMHGLRDLQGKADTPERAAQAHRLLGLANAVADADDLAVICGDFNVEPDSETLRLLAQAGFTDLVTRGGFAGTRTSHYKKPGRFADYMLVNDVSAVVEFDVVSTPEVSDHRPLLLRL
ncbi:MAG: endonuclease/exonuclease/phosphatase family protein [Bacteroidota bacterium]